MQYASWDNARKVLGPYWDKMLEHKFFPLGEMITDVKGMVDFGDRHIPSIIDIAPANNRLQRELGSFTNYAAHSSGIENLSSINYASGIHDFLISGPTGPWRIRPKTATEPDMLVCDTGNYKELIESLRTASSKADILSVFRDTPPPTSLRINGPGDATLLCMTEKVGGYSSTEGSPRREFLYLTAQDKHQARLAHVAIVQYLFPKKEIFDKVGIKVCHHTEYFFLIGKKTSR
ncbi:MAG: hypothetical protein V4664_00140 [Patescibacteria group bacterium]